MILVRASTGRPLSCRASTHATLSYVIPTAKLSKLHDTLLALGKVSIENENNAQPVEDLNSCLEKRKGKLPNNHK